jgi:hypothetical protein
MIADGFDSAGHRAMLRRSQAREKQRTLGLEAKISIKRPAAQILGSDSEKSL